ncbi:hypothetical protein Rhopal_000101-T1 [Rhodotorula paludigena]|uniref:Uncharacterized protein n=1 Tax=Rhodotorula paludigena TaxID=86838 RepID=A0AAV5G475_9BASI|nr:hypothetical protein Rhopal_000101-T1 [Rhodotorula paludigena]
MGRSKHERTHGYPTPPHSPDTDAHGATMHDADGTDARPDAAGEHDHAHVDRFDPLAGYANSPEPATRATAASRVPHSAPDPQPRPATSRTSSRTELRRRTSTRSDREGDAPRRKARAKALQPPKDPDLFDTDEAFQAHAETEKASGWHHLPLVLVALPPLGAIIHGRAENWSDAIILALVVFYLYQLIKVPWELYYASYARTVLPPGVEPVPSSEDSTPEDPAVAAQRAFSAAALRRNELVALATTFCVPAVGAALLHYARGLLSDPDRYLNRFLIGLFVIASSVKPMLHFSKLAKRNSLWHQEVVHYPSSQVYSLQRRVQKLESDLLSRTAAPLSDLDSLSSHLSAPLSTLQRAVRRAASEAHHAQLSSSERLSTLSGAFDQLCSVVEQQEQELAQMRETVAAQSRLVAGARRGGGAGSSPGAAALVGGVVKTLIVYFAARRSGPPYADPSSSAGPRQLENGHASPYRSGGGKGGLARRLAGVAFWPVTLPRSIVSWAVGTGAQKAVRALGWEDDVALRSQALIEHAGADDADEGRGRRAPRSRTTSARKGIAAAAPPAPRVEEDDEFAYEDEPALAAAPAPAFARPARTAHTASRRAATGGSGGAAGARRTSGRASAAAAGGGGGAGGATSPIRARRTAPGLVKGAA